MKIAIYSRKSKFTGKGESVENQVQLCREYIERAINPPGDTKIDVYEDGSDKIGLNQQSPYSKGSALI